MKESRLNVSPVVASILAFVVCSGATAQSPVGASQPAREVAAIPVFDTVVTEFAGNLNTLQMANLDLSYRENFNRLEKKDRLLDQRALFTAQLDRLKSFERDDLTVCQQIEYDIMKVESRLGIERAELALTHDPKSTITDAGIFHQPNGPAWYAYYLARWNGAWLDVDELYAFGEAELAKARADYDQIQTQLGYEDDDAGLARHLKTSHRFAHDDDTLAWFRSQQDVVWQNLPDLFTVTKGLDKAIIKSSDRGASFAVPGYYDLPNETFYFNRMSDTYEGRQADWLLLHEATPGHHYQIASSALEPRCPQRLPGLSYSAYSEGWAAYVETLGEQLGVYQSPEARLAAVEWNMVRSARVALDVGINAYGWSDEQALAYWHTNVRGQRHIAQREVSRMRRWPGQVVTYKYGADFFQRLKTQTIESASDKDSRSALVRRYHDTVVGFRSMPLETFEAVLPELLQE